MAAPPVPPKKITALPTATISYAATPFCTSLVAPQNVTRNGALVGIIVGAATVIIWGNSLSGGIFDLYELLPGFVFNLIATIVVSLLGKPDPAIAAEFEETQKRLRG